MGETAFKEEASFGKAEPNPGFYTVAIFLVNRAYGGPEEGGWWYDYGVLIDDALPEAAEYGIPSIYASETAAEAHSEQMQVRLDLTVNLGRRSIDSVLSTGRYQAMVFPGYPPAHWPETRPHYE